MKVEVTAPKFFSVEELKKNIRSFNLPILLADESFKIIAKNDNFADSKAFRIGSRFDKILMPNDVERLCSLDDGKMIVVDLIGENEKGYASVIRGHGCYLICFRYLADSFVERLYERFNKLSGYDVGITALLTAALSDIGNMKNGKRLFAVIEQLLAELSCVHRLSFFDFSATASALFSTLGDVAPTMSRRINIPNVFPETIAIGNGDDLLLIFAYALVLCFDCTVDGKVDFSARDCSGGINISFSCDVESENNNIDSFVNALHARDSFNKELDSASFWAFFAKLLADTNLWEISASNRGDRFTFKFFIPSVARGEEFCLRDPEILALRSVLLCFFGE